MLLARLLDDKFAALYRAGKIHGGVFLGRGQEALSAARRRFAEKKRCLRAAHPRRRRPAGLWRTGAGRRAHLSRLRARPDARARRQCPSRQAAGGLSADDQPSRRDDFRRERRVVRAPVEGHYRHRRRGLHRRRRDFHRRVSRGAEPGRRRKIAAGLVVANNQYAYSTPTSRQFACDDLADKAVGYGVEVHSVDGTDLSACLETVGEAVAARARRATARNWSSPNCSGFAATANTTTPVTLIRN